MPVTDLEFLQRLPNLQIGMVGLVCPSIFLIRLKHYIAAVQSSFSQHRPGDTVDGIL